MNEKDTGKKSLVRTMADRFGIDPTKLLATLKQTAFRTKGEPVTDEQMVALLIVANQYGLNPFTKEIYAFPDKQNGIIPVVGVDGWNRIINANHNLDGIMFTESEDLVESESGEHKPCPAWMEVTIYRKDRAHPIVVREYFDEVYRPPFSGTKNGHAFTINGPWQTHTKRMCRHKTLIQGSRIAFGFVGIYDEDEAQRITEGMGRNITATSERIPIQMPKPLPEPEPPKIQTAERQPAVAAPLITYEDAIAMGKGLLRAGVTEEEFCKEFNIKELSGLAMDQYSAALDWIQSLKPFNE